MAENNLKDIGVNATLEELNYSQGLTGNIQKQLDRLESSKVSRSSDPPSILGLVGGSITGSGQKLTLSNGIMTKVPLVNRESIYYKSQPNDTGDDLYYILEDGGVRIMEGGWYLIAGSVYISSAASNGTILRGAYIRDNEGNELVSAVDSLVNNNSAGGVSTASKIMFIPTDTVLYLYGRVKGSTGILYTNNNATFLTLLRIGW